MKSVSIVGRAPGFEKALEAEGALWCVSSAFKLLNNADKVDLVFQMHKPPVWEDWLTEIWQKVVVAYPGPFRLYPVEAMVKKYGFAFGSSISWMIALAIEQGYERINIFGVEMASQVEYAEQRDTLFYMVGRAEALGIKVVIPKGSRLFFKDRMYGVM